MSRLLLLAPVVADLLGSSLRWGPMGCDTMAPERVEQRHQGGTNRYTTAIRFRPCRIDRSRWEERTLQEQFR